MPEVAAILDLSERAARDWVKRHDLPTRGTRPVRVAEALVFLQRDAEAREPRKPPEVRTEAPGSAPEAPGSAEPIEAAYRVTPAEIEQAVGRTSAQYMGDLRTMLAEVGTIYAGQLAAKDQALAMQAAALAAKDETIAELRRRAEVAESAVARRVEEAAPDRERDDARRARAAKHIKAQELARDIRRSGPPSLEQRDRMADRLEAQDARGATPAAPARSPGWWTRLRDRLRGD